MFGIILRNCWIYATQLLLNIISRLLVKSGRCICNCATSALEQVNRLLPILPSIESSLQDPNQFTSIKIHLQDLGRVLLLIDECWYTPEFHWIFKDRMKEALVNSNTKNNFLERVLKFYKSSAERDLRHLKRIVARIVKRRRYAECAHFFCKLYHYIYSLMKVVCTVADIALLKVGQISLVLMMEGYCDKYENAYG